MTPDDYFNDHIPHRVNLLIAFRERYSGRDPSRSLHPEAFRDLFRCAKDISMVMVRFFFAELGVRFSDDGASLEPKKNGRIEKLGLRRLDLEVVKRDPRSPALIDVLKAANRAIAHLAANDCDHPIKTDADHATVFTAIDWTEDLVGTHIYEPAHRNMGDAMRLPQNRM